jgi:hypothetical protein
MPKIKNILVATILFIAFTLTAFAVARISNPIAVADDISLEEIEDCATEYWNETEPIIGECTYNYTERQCDDPSLNTSCISQEKSRKYPCQIGSQIVQKSKESCSDKELRVIVDELLGQKTYKLDYGDWGKCSYSPGNFSLVIICDSRLDGNGDGICQSGESCIGFVISKYNIQRLLKNSRTDFAIDDDTFYQEQLNMEVI